MQNMFENFTKPPKFMKMKQNRISRRFNLVKSLDYKSENKLARTQLNFLENTKDVLGIEEKLWQLKCAP